jgi:hypothetical protein
LAQQTAAKQSAVQEKRRAALAAKAAKRAQQAAEREGATRKRLATEDAIIAALNVRQALAPFRIPVARFGAYSERKRNVSPISIVFVFSSSHCTCLPSLRAFALPDLVGVRTAGRAALCSQGEEAGKRAALAARAREEAERKKREVDAKRAKAAAELARQEEASRAKKADEGRKQRELEERLKKIEDERLARAADEMRRQVRAGIV